MKMKFGAIVVDGRGKIGGHVASKNRGGAYLRTKVTPSNPNTGAQSLVRSRITLLSKAFGNLGASLISAWNGAVQDWGKTDIFGDIKNPSGLNLFVKLNANLMEIGQSVINTPPQKGSVGSLTINTAGATSSPQAISVDFLEPTFPANTSVIVRASAPTSAGVSNFSGKLANLVVKTAYDTGQELDFTTEYTNKYGALQAGTKIAVEFVPVDQTTGQKGAVVSTSFVVS